MTCFLHLDLCVFSRTVFVVTSLKDKHLQGCPQGNKGGRLFGVSVGRLIRLLIFLTGSSSSTPFSTPRQPLPPPLSLPPFSGTLSTYRSPQTSRRQVRSSIIENQPSEFCFRTRRIQKEGCDRTQRLLLWPCLPSIYHVQSAWWVMSPLKKQCSFLKR